MNSHTLAVVLLTLVSVIALSCLYLAGRGLPAEIIEELPETDIDLPPLDYRQFQGRY